jgi:predicted amidophosphoribosyltransferase
MLSKLIALIAPPLCVACGAHAGRAGLLCRECRAWLRREAGGWPVPAAASSAGASTAGRCWTAFPYEGPAGALVRALKFHGRVAVADLMAAQMAALAALELDPAVVVPVPVHPAHRRRRGVDHSSELARAFARRAGLPFSDCLIRRGDPRPQVGRGRRARMAGPLGSIAVKPGLPVPRHVVIVDDVVTTGATIAACATVLRAAGAQRVTPLAYARTTAR